MRTNLLVENRTNRKHGPSFTRFDLGLIIGRTFVQGQLTSPQLTSTA